MTYVPARSFRPGDLIVNRLSRRRMGWNAPKWRVEQVLPNGELNCWNPRRGWRTITHPENYLKFEQKALTLAAGAAGMEER
jgi:hypothetical protein